MKYIKLFLLLTYILFSDTCMIEPFEISEKLLKNLKTFKKDNDIPFIKSSQGHESTFYYTEKDKKLYYVKIIIYSEMGQRIIELLYQNNGLVKTKTIKEFYDTYIYEGNMNVLSKNIEIFPICKNIPNLLYNGVQKDDYQKMVEFEKKITTFFKNLIRKNTTISNDKLLDLFKKEIQKDSLPIKCTTKKKNNFLHIYPHDVNKHFNLYVNTLDKNLTKDIIKNIDEDCKKTGEGSLEWNILHSTNNYFGFQLKEGYSFCYPSFQLITKYLNLFYVNNKLYKVSLSNDAKLKSVKITWTDKDCIPNKETILKKQLIPKDNNIYMRVFYGKVCSQDISLEFIKNNFIFTEINRIKRIKGYGDNDNSSSKPKPPYAKIAHVHKTKPF